MSFVRVITPTLTFYPPNSQQQDDQTINGILNFINSSMECKLQYFRTNKQTIVFSSWNSILFIVAGVDESVAYLRFRIQMIREIAVFLFGPEFDQIMRNNIISTNLIDLFAKYVDAFLEMTENDYGAQLGIISHDPFFMEYTNYIAENIPTSQFPHDLLFIDCFILRDHKIISRLNLSDSNPISYLSIFILSLFSRIEYPNTATSHIQNNEDKQNSNQNTEITENENDPINIDDKDFKFFDPNYVNITEPPSIQLRTGYIAIGNILQQCTISSTLLGPNSPYIALFIAQESNKKVKPFIVSGIISLISSSMSEVVRLIVSPLSFTSPGLVYYLATNRTSGETFDFEMSNDEKSHQITRLLFRTMKNYTIDALVNGQTTFIWRDTHFLFVYSIFFIQSDGKSILPTEKAKVPLFKEDYNLTYQTISSELFHKDKNLRIYEVYSIFLSVIPPHVAYSETIDMFIETVKKKKISFIGSADSLKASLLPYNKKNKSVMINS